MKTLLFGFITTVVSACFSLTVSAEGEGTTGEGELVSLWPKGSAGVDASIQEKERQKGKEPKVVLNIHNPSVSVFLPENPNGASVVICPGGGYRILGIEKGGYDIAKRLNRDGITAFVLRYRLPTTKGAEFKHPVPLSDALRAIQWVRFHHEDYGVDVDKIGIMGFSAGGHLAASAATLYAKYSFGEDAVSKVSSRPDFVCLGFPVISMEKEISHNSIKSLVDEALTPSQVDELSCEKNVDADTPPTFLFHAKDDNVVKYRNSVIMHEALKAAGVEAELKLYEKGKHGFGLGVKGTDSINWPSDFVSWVSKQGFIPASDEFYTPEEDLAGLEVSEEMDTDLPNVLVIGDSISIGYTPVVVDTLKGVANVKRIRENAGDTNRGLTKLDRWLGKTDWDVIHFNWGLHDLCYRHPEAKVYGKRDKERGTQAIPLADYSKNLEELVIRLKETGAKLIWGSTTLVPEEEAGRFVGDAALYNEAAAAIMKQHDIPVDDLYAVSSENTEHFKSPGDVHFSKEGYRILGEQVAASIKQHLK